MLGAGVLGAQIAYQAAYAGFNVVSYDINDDAIAAAKKRFEKLDSDYKRDVDDATDEKIAETHERLSQSKDLKEAVSEADLVIEAVPEKLELKREVWSTVGKAAPEHTIFTTNTSTLLPSDFADASGRSDKFLALHFANRLWAYRTAEIMPTEKTDEKIRQTVVDYANEMQMWPSELKKEHAGYIQNSLLVPFLEAAQRLWLNGIAEPKEIDRTWRNCTGNEAGPFEGMDIVGLRTASTIAKSKDDPELVSFGEKVEHELIDNGKFGVESREGFFRYDEDGKRIDD